MLLEYTSGSTADEVAECGMLDNGMMMVHPGETGQQFRPLNGVDRIGIKMLRCGFDTCIFRIFETVVAGTRSDFRNTETTLLQQGHFGFFVENVRHFPRKDMKPYERFHPFQNDFRDPFSRDRDRVIHCSSFRRLEYKTQVFLNHEGDYFRTRLTHSLEVSQIARTLARQLELNETLAEVIALSHDLGHTPFGHVGGDELDRLLKADGHPLGFEHNFQSFRVLTKLEKRYKAFDGLNLTFATLEGVLKHSYPYEKPFLKNIDARFALDKHPSPMVEEEGVSRDEPLYRHRFVAGLIKLLVEDFIENSREKTAYYRKEEPICATIDAKEPLPAAFSRETATALTGKCMRESSVCRVYTKRSAKTVTCFLPTKKRSLTYAVRTEWLLTILLL